MTCGRHPKSTVLVQVGKCRPFSGVSGRHMVRLDNTTQKSTELITKLKSCGCSLNQDGADWTSEGDFTVKASRPKTVKSGRSK
jgi:hypothetical protein